MSLTMQKCQLGEKDYTEFKMSIPAEWAVEYIRLDFERE